jgi:hypothetical protein
MNTDPVRQRREQLARLASAARKAGWTFFAIACVAFIAGLLIGLTGLVVFIVMGSLAIGSGLLLPAIIVGFGVSAAEREDRG